MIQNRDVSQVNTDLGERMRRQAESFGALSSIRIPQTSVEILMLHWFVLRFGREMGPLIPSS